MKQLLAFILGITYVDNRNSVSPLVETLFSNYSRVTIFSNQLNNVLYNTSFSFPVILQTSKSRNNIPNSSQAIFVQFSSDFLETDLKRLHWNYNTKFLVEVNEEYVDTALNILRRYDICYSLVVSTSTDGLVVYKNDFRFCDKIFGYNTSFHRIQNRDLFQELSYKGCHLNVSFVDYPPFGITSINGRMGGHEGSNIQAVADKIGFIPNYIYHHEGDWGSFDPPTGLEGDVGTGRSFIGFSALYPFERRNTYTDLIQFCYSEQLSFIVPTGAAHVSPTWFIILVSEFSPIVWYLIAATFILMNFVSAIMAENQNLSKMVWPFHNLGLILGMPQQLLQPRTITLTSSLFGYVLTTAYRAGMSSQLTAPAKIPDINTIEQLADAKYGILGPATVKNILEKFGNQSENSRHLTWALLASRYTTSTKPTLTVLKQIAYERNTAMLTHTSKMRFLTQKEKYLSGLSHLMDDLVLQYIPGAILKKNSCLTPQVKRVLRQLCDSGLSKKWYEDLLSSTRQKDRVGPRKLSVLDIKGFLFLLLFGWGLSAFTFLFEVAVDKFDLDL